jgi:hypothetical protein
VYSCSPGGHKNSSYETPPSPSHSPPPLNKSKSLQRADPKLLLDMVRMDSPLEDFAQKFSQNALQDKDEQISYRIPFTDNEHFIEPRTRSESDASIGSNVPRYSCPQNISTKYQDLRSIRAQSSSQSTSSRPPANRPPANRLPSHRKLSIRTDIDKMYSPGPHPYDTPPLPILLPRNATTPSQESSPVPSPISSLELGQSEGVLMMQRQRYVSAGGHLPLTSRNEVAAPFVSEEDKLMQGPNHAWKTGEDESKKKKKGFMAKFKERIGKQ